MSAPTFDPSEAKNEGLRHALDMLGRHPRTALGWALPAEYPGMTKALKLSVYHSMALVAAAQGLVEHGDLRRWDWYGRVGSRYLGFLHLRGLAQWDGFHAESGRLTIHGWSALLAVCTGQAHEDCQEQYLRALEGAWAQDGAA